MQGKALKRKVLVYCMRDGHLLVLRHPTYAWEQVGIQVPGGNVNDSEDVLAAGLREPAGPEIVQIQPRRRRMAGQMVERIAVGDGGLCGHGVSSRHPLCLRT